MKIIPLAIPDVYGHARGPQEADLKAPETIRPVLHGEQPSVSMCLSSARSVAKPAPHLRPQFAEGGEFV